MGACGSSPQLGESQDLEEPDLDRQFTRAEDSDDASPPDPTAKRARAAANRFVQFTGAFLSCTLYPSVTAHSRTTFNIWGKNLDHGGMGTTDVIFSLN